MLTSSETFGHWSSQRPSLVTSYLYPMNRTVRDSVTQIGNHTSKSETSIQSRIALNVGETENLVTDHLEAVQQREHRRYARLSGYWNQFETKMSVSRRKRSARMLQQCAEQSQSLLLYYNIVQIARLVFHRAMDPTLHYKMRVTCQ